MKKQTERERNSPWRPSDVPALAIARALVNNGIAFLREHRKWKWMLISVAALALLQTYFVRELFAALLFFTIFYLFLVALVLLYVFFTEGLDQGSAWIGLHVRTFLTSARHHVASPAQAVNTPKYTALQSARKERSRRNILH